MKKPNLHPKWGYDINKVPGVLCMFCNKPIGRQAYNEVTSLARFGNMMFIHQSCDKIAKTCDDKYSLSVTNLTTEEAMATAKKKTAKKAAKKTTAKKATKKPAAKKAKPKTKAKVKAAAKGKKATKKKWGSKKTTAAQANFS